MTIKFFGEKTMYKIKSDKKLNPELKKQMVGLRSAMFGQVNKTKLPKRFTIVMNNDEPNGNITDTTTGRISKRVPLCALGDVKQTLNDLFG